MRTGSIFKETIGAKVLANLLKHGSADARTICKRLDKDHRWDSLTNIHHEIFTLIMSGFICQNNLKTVVDADALLAKILARTEENIKRIKAGKSQRGRRGRPPVYRLTIVGTVAAKLLEIDNPLSSQMSWYFMRKTIITKLSKIKSPL